MPRQRTFAPIQTVKAWHYGAMLAGRENMPLSGDCISPLVREIRGAQDKLIAHLPSLRRWRDDPWSDYADGYGFIGPRPSRVEPLTATAYVEVRCRKCDACLRHRARQWIARSCSELALANRTWFVTLTFAPEQRFRVKQEASKASRIYAPERFEITLTDHEQFSALASAAGKHVTRWLKRVRKNSGARFRYLLVAEAHKDGFPHFHLLLHEGTSIVTKRTLQGAWTAGFSSAKVVDCANGKAGYYVCKYLTKSVSARVRASLKYGCVNTRALSEAALLAIKNARDAMRSIGEKSVKRKKE